jgi:hypothetical protein
MLLEKEMKKIISLVLLTALLCLLLCSCGPGDPEADTSEVATASDIVPTPETSEDASSVTVKVTVYSAGGFSKGSDSTVMIQIPVSVSDRNENGTFDLDDTLTAVHEEYCTGGYEVTGDGADRKILRLWNQSDGNFICYLNDTPVTNLEEQVDKGDSLVACILGSVKPEEVIYTYFDTSYANLTTADTLQMKVKAISVDDSNTVSEVTLGSLQIAQVNGEGKYEGIDNAYTQSDGSFSLNFPTAGTYYITVVPTDATMIPATCVIVVN